MTNFRLGNRSISIACWVVVFSPQIIENFRRGSADGLSLLFLIVWLAGDVFNILGAVFQGVLPTMIILAVYYTLADIVLLGQCFYYRGFTLSDHSLTITKTGQSSASETNGIPDQATTERTALLDSASGNGHSYTDGVRHHAPSTGHAHQSHSHIHHHFVDGTHLSPVTPFIDQLSSSDESTEEVSPTRRRGLSAFQTAILNTLTVLMVCAAGIFGWYVSSGRIAHKPPPPPGGEEGGNSSLEFDMLGQLFGYLCAVLYLGSRIPQLLLNYRRKSTEGVSLLFFLFACIGNLTYVLSIFAYSPACVGTGQKGQGPQYCQPGEAASIYGHYILVNLSWLLGSLGTFLLDMGIFVQFFLYRTEEDEDTEDEDGEYDSIDY